MIDWYNLIKSNYGPGKPYGVDELNIFVAKGKITEEQKDQIISEVGD